MKQITVFVGSNYRRVGFIDWLTGDMKNKLVAKQILLFENVSAYIVVGCFWSYFESNQLFFVG